MIQINNLYKNFGKTEILKNINLKIEEGDVYGIIGHSGAGKSTLLRCINHLDNFEKGTINVMNKDLSNLSKAEIRILRKDLGMIFQNFNLLSRDTVYNNIALPLKIWGYDKSFIDKKVRSLLKIINLEDKANAKPKNLSGGQKQRVAIARALTLDPKVLLCDEATSALDPKTTKDILNLLKKINTELGITIVLVTHQMEVIKEICNKVSLMEKGHILYSGYVDNLFLHPNKNLSEFLGERSENLLDGVNLKIFFPNSISKSSIITSMARKLDIDFSIVGGKLENFRDKLLGTLTINFPLEYNSLVTDYLNSLNIQWEVL